MKRNNTNSTLGSKLYITHRKFNNLHTRITDLIEDKTFSDISEKVKKNLLRRLELLYRRLLRLLSRTKYSAAAFTAAFLMITGSLEAQTFTEQTGASNPFNSIDVRGRSDPTFVDIDGDGDMDAFIGKDDGYINYFKNNGTALLSSFIEQTGTSNPLNSVDVGDYSAPTFVDVDGDGDMDAFIGEYYGTMYYYKNTGTALVPTFTEQTGTSNPLNVDVGDYSSPTFTDVDGDGDMDAFIGENHGKIFYYKNTGTAITPSFTLQTGTANPFNGVDVGHNSKPTFVDIDSDGLMDAFIGKYQGNINCFKNTGTALLPSFTLQTGTSNPLNVDVGDYSAPTFTDVDGDGDMDAVVGENEGYIKYYKNTSPLHSPPFAEQTGTANPFNGVSEGYKSAPTFIDLDGDGDKDAVIGEFGGNINYHKNTGDALTPAFTKQIGIASPFNNLLIVDSSTPTFADIDGDGDMDAFSGDYSGAIYYYKNTGTALVPSFTEQTGISNPFNGVVGDFSAPTFVDVDGDGDMDAFIGGYDGTIKYYKNNGSALLPSFTVQTHAANPFYGVDLGSASAPTFADVDGDGDMDAFIGELDGNINYYKNTGTALVPTFTEQTGTSNPFNGVDVGGFSFPTFVDIDGDGDLDAFSGEVYGKIKYYKDTYPVPPSVSLNTKVFLQGSYDSGAMTTSLNTQGVIPLTQPFNQAPWNYSGTESVASIPSSDVVDWILLEIRTTTESSSMVAERAGFILSDGTIVDIDGSSAIKFEGVSDSDYYIVVKHRNHLSIMSSTAVSLE